MDTTLLKPEEEILVFETFLLQKLDKQVACDYLSKETCTLEQFGKGRDIYTPTHFRRSLAVLLSGRASVRKGELAVSVLEPGDLFGAAALFTQRPEYESTITARTDCRVIFLPQALVGELLGRHPAAAASYIRYLSERVRFLSRRLDGLAAPGAAEKLGRYLLEQGDMTCSAVELARRLDVSRASLYRALERLETLGAIEKRGKQITVRSRDILNAMEVTL